MSNPSGGMPQAGSNTTVGPQQVTEATITVGTVFPTDSLAQYTPTTNSTWIYTDYEVRNKYEGDKHVLMAGITSPAGFQGNSVSFFQMASSTLLWIADWTACRFNQLPNIPNPVVSDTNWILLDQHYELADTKYGPDGVSPLYRVTGTYIYGHLNPNSDIVNNVQFGLSPEFQPPMFTTLSPTIYAQGIINPTAGGNNSNSSASPGQPPSIQYATNSTGS